MKGKAHPAHGWARLLRSARPSATSSFVGKYVFHIFAPEEARFDVRRSVGKSYSDLLDDATH